MVFLDRQMRVKYCLVTLNALYLYLFPCKILKLEFLCNVDGCCRCNYLARIAESFAQARLTPHRGSRCAPTDPQSCLLASMTVFLIRILRLAAFKLSWVCDLALRHVWHHYLSLVFKVCFHIKNLNLLPRVCLKHAWWGPIRIKSGPCWGYHHQYGYCVC